MGKLLEQGLTWVYVSNSGKLKLNVKTHFNLDGGEKLKTINRIEYINVNEYKLVFDMDTSGTVTDSYEDTFETHYALETGMNNSEVRAAVNRLAIKLTTTIKDDTEKVGEVINITSGNANISIE
ncbi:MAG: hypothetical protein K0B08_07120 [Bacteroidales bacterium]|nr:hypothetical protein [Bacteroidales bacterium]